MPRRPARTDEPGPARPAALQPEDVRAVYGRLLERTPSVQEISEQIANARSLDVLLRVVVESEEFRETRNNALRATEVDLVNVWTPELADHSHAPGTTSPDGVAQVGHDGWVFLIGGSNAVLDQLSGRARLPLDWDNAWQEAARARRAGAAAVGAAYLGIIVPDKLAVLSEAFTGSLASGPSPARRLSTDASVDALYPVEQLQAVPGGAFLRTDSHLSLAGNAALARTVLSRLGVDADVGSSGGAAYVSSGDLGMRFQPRLVEVMSAVGSLGDAVLVDDNYEQVRAAGVHLGTRRVLNNPRAADHRTVVVFGDSFGFPAPHHQGLAWHLAQHFASVHFVWAPFGWDPDYVRHAKADVVLCEAAERFVVRPPSVVDVGELEKAALARVPPADGRARA